MTFIHNYELEIKDDLQRYIDFDRTGAIDYIEYIRIELRKEPTSGFDEIHPCDLFKKMYIPHLGMIIRILFMKLIGYVYHPFDDKNHPNIRIYYKSYKYWHHSHDFLGKNIIITSMTIDEAMEYINKEKLDIQIFN